MVLLTAHIEKRNFNITYLEDMTSLVAQRVKNPLSMQETWVQSLGQEDPLEKGMVTHSSFLAWKIPWTEEPGGYSPQGCTELDTSEAT